MRALLGTFNQEKALAGTFSVIVNTSPNFRCKLKCSQHQHPAQITSTVSSSERTESKLRGGVRSGWAGAGGGRKQVCGRSLHFIHSMFHIQHLPARPHTGGGRHSTYLQIVKEKIQEQINLMTDENWKKHTNWNKISSSSSIFFSICMCMYINSNIKINVDSTLMFISTDKMYI